MSAISTPIVNGNNIEITVKKEIPRQRIVDLLCCGYDDALWIDSFQYNPAGKPTEEECREICVKLGIHPDHHRKEVYPVVGGSHFIRIHHTGAENPSGKNYTDLNLELCLKGLKIMAEKYPLHFDTFINESEDAITGDVFIQCCVFGEIVFG